MNAERKARRFRVICGLVVFFSVLFCKINTDTGFRSLWDILYMIRDGMLRDGNWGVRLHWMVAFAGLLANSLYFIRSIWLMRGRKMGFFEVLPGVGLILYVMSAGFALQPYAFVGIMVLIFDYMGARWIEEREAINKAYEEQKARELAEKEEIKRVRHFPGRYPEEFFQMIRKNAVYGKKGQMILSAGCILISAFMYIMLTMYGLISQVHGEEDFALGFGLARIFRQTGLLMGLCSILMMTMIISHYIKDQKKSNRLLVILGMRSRTVYLMFGIVFAANVILSGIAGTVIGGAAAYLVRDIWQSGLTNNGVAVELASAISGKTIGMGILGYLVIVLLSLGFNQENVLNLARSMNMNAEVQKEKRGKKHALLLAVFGTLLWLISIRIYWSRSWAETMFIHILTVLGLYLLLVGGISIYLSRLEHRKDKYYRSLLAKRPLYYRCNKSTWNLFYLSVIHLFILAVFAIQLTGGLLHQNIARLYPYDIVCTAYDADMQELGEIAKEHDAKVQVYPMLRITSIYGSDAPNIQWGGVRPIQWPQGQHIAVSESTYRALKEAQGKTPMKLNLTGDEIHVVYQQDLSAKAHTIDWDTNRIHKMLRIGQPMMNYVTADYEKVFPERKTKSEELDSLTGVFHEGMEDNLVVFNDVYFEKEYERISDYNRKQWSQREAADADDWNHYTYTHTANMTEGPTQLLCIDVPEKEYAGMLKDMDYLVEKHAFDSAWDSAILPFYGKQQMIVDTGAEIFFRKLVYLFIVVLLSIMGLFQYYVKFESEAGELKWQNQFLKKLGLREKERKAVLTGQMKIFAVLPLIIGTCGGILFGGLSVKARLYDAAALRSFLLTGAVVYLIYIGIWIIWYLWIKKLIWRQAEWEK